MKHYLLDFGATLGSASTHSHNAATGHEHSFDVPKLLKSLFTLGLLGKPWDKSKTMEHPLDRFAFKFKTVSENVKLSFTDLGIDGGLWQPERVRQGFPARAA
ncbi:hypothetical protein IH992_01000 [Candidatus Poribacteria bacterium]|nr:hypothetical protein [Candidatus Poribacteria bacterium]